MVQEKKKNPSGLVNPRPKENTSFYPQRAQRGTRGRTGTSHISECIYQWSSKSSKLSQLPPTGPTKSVGVKISPLVGDIADGAQANCFDS